jgi:hypothetical protein
MTGKAREHEVRLMGLWLAAFAVVAVLLAIWVATTVGSHLRPPTAGGASVTQSSGGPLGLG